jgi:glycosyltransferase involved in cell wall biosynthesis
MNFTIIGPVYPYRGGIAHYTSQLIKSLEKARHTVQAVSYKRQYPKWLYPGKSDKDPSQIKFYITAQYLLDPLNPYTWWLTARNISQQKPDLVVIQWWTTFWALAYACIGWFLERRNIKVGFIIHNVLPHEPRFFDPFLAKMALSTGQYFIAQTEKEKERLLRLLPGREVGLCHLPTYAFLAERKIPKDDARQKLGIPLSTSLILFFGIVRPYKGIKFLLDSMAILKYKDTDHAPFLIVAGEIWENKEAFQEQIKQLRLEDCVRLDDRYIPDEEASVMFSAADIFVAPYIDGTQSAAVGLALGFDLPMVVTDVVVAGISEENRQNIRVVRCGDAEGLAKALQEEIAEPSRFQHRRQSGDEDWQRLVNALEEFA